MTKFTRFEYNLLIKEHHLDTFGHVNNATYLEILEEARWELLHQRGMTLANIHQTGIGPVVLECTIQFLKEIQLRQWITIESQVDRYEKKIGVMHQAIRNEQGELCSHAKFTFGVFDLKARKLIVPTEEWLYAVGVSV